MAHSSIVDDRLDDIVSLIRRREAEFRSLGTAKMYAFDNLWPSKGLDVFVDYDRDSTFSLLTLAQIKLAIEDDTGLNVHITTIDNMPESRRAELERPAVRVF